MNNFFNTQVYNVDTEILKRKCLITGLQAADGKSESVFDTNRRVSSVHGLNLNLYLNGYGTMSGSSAPFYNRIASQIPEPFYNVLISKFKHLLPISDNVFKSSLPDEVTEDQFDFSQLPDEVIEAVAFKIDDRQDFINLKLTCKRVLDVVSRAEERKCKEVLRSRGLKVIAHDVLSGQVVYAEYSSRKGDWYEINIAEDGSFSERDNPRCSKISEVYAICTKTFTGKGGGVKSETGMLCELEDKSKCHLSGEFDELDKHYSGREMRGAGRGYQVEMKVSGLVKKAPSWRILFSDMQSHELLEFVDEMKQRYPSFFTDWLLASQYNEKELKRRFTIVFEKSDR